MTIIKSLRSKNLHVLGKILLASFVFCGMFSCKSSKDIARKPSETDIKRLEQLIFTNGNFSNLTSKVEFKLMPKAGVSVGMKGTLKISRDSCIILSLQPFAGIEAAKCLIRKDSIFIVSRLHQTYAVEDLRNLKYSQYVNLNLLEALLTNRVFIPGQAAPKINDVNKFEWHKQKEGDYYRLPDENYILDFCLNPDGEYNQLRASSPELQEKVNVQYDYFEAEGPLIFPHKVLISAVGPEKTIQFQVLYVKPSFNSSKEFRFDIPTKYKKVTTEELIKRFQSML